MLTSPKGKKVPVKYDDDDDDDEGDDDDDDSFSDVTILRSNTSHHNMDHTEATTCRNPKLKRHLMRNDHGLKATLRKIMMV